MLGWLATGGARRLRRFCSGEGTACHVAQPIAGEWHIGFRESRFRSSGHNDWQWPSYATACRSPRTKLLACSLCHPLQAVA